MKHEELEDTAGNPATPVEDVRTAPIITTAPGTRAEAFGPVEWGLLAAIAGMWGSAFLLTAIGLEAFRPGLVALLNIAFGATVLSLSPGPGGASTGRTSRGSRSSGPSGSRSRSP